MISLHTGTAGPSGSVTPEPGDPPVTPQVVPVISASITSVSTVVAAANETVDDAMLTTAQTVTRTGYQMTFVRPSSGTVIWTSSNEGVATVDSNGLVTGVSNGLTLISATDGTSSAVLNIAITSTTSAVSYTGLVGYVTGSLARHASYAVDSRIGGDLSAYGESATATPTGELSIFSTQNHSTPTYVRNANCWAADLDLTCISPWNSAFGNQRAGVAISKNHVAFAAHYPLAVGSTIRFITADNQVVERTISATMLHPDRVATFPDIAIAKLSAPLPASIGVAKVLPDSASTKLPHIFSNPPTVYASENPFAGQTVIPIPVLSLDQEEKALVQMWLSEVYTGEATARTLIYPSRYVAWQNQSRVNAFSENLISGDSGNPSFAIVNDELVLLTVWSSSCVGTSLTHLLDDYNAILSALGGGETLTEADLSGFTTY